MKIFSLESGALFFKKLKLRPSAVILLLIVSLFFYRCNVPHEDIVLKQIRDVVVDANTDPTLRANAIFYNPNDMRGKLKRINVEVFVNGKKGATINQKLRTEIPAKNEFTVPLEVKLSIKELGFMDTLLGVLGGKKFEIRYQGSLRLTYRGLPITVPVNYKDEVRVSF